MGSSSSHSEEGKQTNSEIASKKKQLSEIHENTTWFVNSAENQASECKEEIEKQFGVIETALRLRKEELIQQCDTRITEKLTNAQALLSDVNGYLQSITQMESDMSVCADKKSEMSDTDRMDKFKSVTKRLTIIPSLAVSSEKENVKIQFATNKVVSINSDITQLGSVTAVFNVTTLTVPLFTLQSIGINFAQIEFLMGDESALSECRYYLEYIFVGEAAERSGVVSVLPWSNVWSDAHKIDVTLSKSDPKHTIYGLKDNCTYALRLVANHKTNKDLYDYSPIVQFTTDVQPRVVTSGEKVEFVVDYYTRHSQINFPKDLYSIIHDYIKQEDLRWHELLRGKQTSILETANKVEFGLDNSYSHTIASVDYTIKSSDWSIFAWEYQLHKGKCAKSSVTWFLGFAGAPFAFRNEGKSIDKRDCFDDVYLNSGVQNSFSVSFHFGNTSVGMKAPDTSTKLRDNIEMKEQCKDGDTVKLIVDYTKDTVALCVNNTFYGDIFKTIPTELIPIVSSRSFQHCSITHIPDPLSFIRQCTDESVKP